MFIASLHCSLRKKFILNVLLLLLLLIIALSPVDEIADIEGCVISDADATNEFDDAFIISIICD